MAVIRVIAFLFLLQSCNEKEEFEDFSHEVPVMENPGDSSIVTEGLLGRSGVTKDGYLFGVPIFYEEIDGMAIFEGDILLSPAQLQQKDGSENERSSGAGNAAPSHLWPNNTVYYTIDAALPDKQRVKDAIQHWNVFTNLTFIESSTQPNRIKFVKGDGCLSPIGMIGGVQEIKVGPDCTAGNIMHEIGHSVGLFHEHTRTDRDNHINIIWNNIQPSYKYAFEKYADRLNEKGFPYVMGFDHGILDYRSIMMYGRFAFAIDPSKPTITKKDGTTYNAQRSFLTANDIACVNDLYPGSMQKVTGPLAQSVGVGANGTVYLLSKNPNNLGFEIYKYLGSAGWTKEANIGAIALDVAPDGTPWVVTKNYEIFRKVGNNWVKAPGNARDIGVGADGTVWVISNSSTTGGYKVYRINENSWTSIGGSGGVAIDVTSDGRPYVITSDKQIYFKSPQSWSLVKAPWYGQEIACDSNGGVYILSGVGNYIYKWTGITWMRQPGDGAKISAGQNNKVWTVKKDGTIYRRV